MSSATALIVGNTYPVKDKLRDLGGRWNPAAKGWDVPSDMEAAAKALVAGSPVVNSGQGYRPSRCKECGCAPSRYNRIYRSGVCKNCYIDEKEERDMGY